MNNLKIKKFLCLLGLGFLIGCGSSTGGTNPPNQDTVNQDIEHIASYIINLSGDIDGTSCEFFNLSAETFPGIFPCTGVGNTIISIRSQSCEEGPPLQASLVVDILLEDCSDTAGNISNGGFRVDFEIDGEVGSAHVTSSNYEQDGISYTLDISGMVNSQGIVTCSGTATAEGFSCEITQDCNSCLF